jgi:CheY-like chemotaxis protein
MVSIPKVIVIDDSLVDAFFLRHAFDGLGEPYLFQILSDGEAALAFIAKHRAGLGEPNPCVILLDLNLPTLTGLEVLAAIRQEPSLNHVHVVVLTSCANPEEESNITELGGICRTKPLDIPTFKVLAAEVVTFCKGLASSTWQ